MINILSAASYPGMRRMRKHFKLFFAKLIEKIVICNLMKMLDEPD
jgi:hypothetical protein